MTALTLKKSLLAVLLLTTAACSTSKENEPEPNLGPSAASDGVAGSEEDLDLRGAGRRHYFSFIRAGKDDPQRQISFGVNQTTQVNEAIAALTKNPFAVETELNPQSMSIERYRDKFKRLRETTKAQDTVVIYSHSHGVGRGLALNWNESDRMKILLEWKTLAEEIVSLPAKNVIVFNMSCHSGGLTDALNSISAKWKGQRAKAGRNLIVLTPVANGQLSKATNFDTSSEGIGNPFTWSVKTALRGDADGFNGARKDGKTSMKELVSYVLANAKEKSTDGYAEPQFAGEYNENDLFL